MEDKNLKEVLNKVSDSSNRRCANSNSMEVENMVRRAETLNSIRELNLSDHTQKLIEKKFGTDVDSIVKIGRDIALGYDMHPEHEDKGPGYIRELVKALDEAGFVRHDIYPRTWCIWGLYAAMLNYYSLAIGKISLATLVVRRDFTSSKEYESMVAVSDNDFEKLMVALGSLTERERTILVLRFGLDDGAPKSLKQVGKAFGVTGQYIRQLEVRALIKMREPSRLCKLPALFGFIPPAPPAEPEPEYHFSEDGTKTANIDTDDIRNLNLSARVYNRLKRSERINTVEDILNYPKEDWPKIKYLGRKGTLEIQDKMRAVGYPDFCINLS